MKTFGISIVLLFGLVCAQGQTAVATTQKGTAVPTDTAYAVVERGANHRIWQRTTYEQGPNGMVMSKVHRYTELASGMHYKDANGNWQESQELIESYSGGAVARRGQYQVIFANNLNSQGAIDMQTPDGKRLRSNILGLMYVDTATGDAVMIAGLKDSTGQIVSANQVLYADAFDGVKADVRYTYRKDGFEQDVILREQPPTPESYGLDSDTTVLEVVTEFINPPAANLTETQGTTTDQVDDAIDWGATKIGRGKAFDLNKGRNDITGVPVNKKYINLQGRHFLLERVKFDEVQSELSGLPQQSSLDKERPVMASKEPTYPATPLARVDKQSMRMASAMPPNQGYVLDYQTINSGLTNYTFQGDKTYYISGSVALYGTNTFEGGTVIKYIGGSAGLALQSGGIIYCRASAYRPIVFTSMNDNVIGEIISGSSGSPAMRDYGIALNLNNCGSQAISDVRILYASAGITYNGSISYVEFIKNAQFINCYNGISAYNPTINIENALFRQSGAGISTYSASAIVQNTTFDRCNYLPAVHNLYATNCIFANQTNGSTANFVGSHNGFYNCAIFGDSAITNSANPFQTVGGGSYYLTNGCAFFNAGTTNIDPVLLASLSTKTTHPPIVFSDVAFYAATNLLPPSIRDTDTPDLGYHYDPLDYAFNMVSISSNITFAAGTAVAWFSKYASSTPGWGVGDPWGMGLANNVTATFAGTAEKPCEFVDYCVVQEGSTTNWMRGFCGGMCAVGGYNNNDFPSLNADFTLFSNPAWDANFFRDYGNGLVVRAKNSEFHGNQGGYDLDCYFTNCLLFRLTYWQGTADSAYSWETYRDVFQNCTFYGGSVQFDHWESSPYWKVLIKDCAFDGTTLNLYAVGGGLSTWLTSDYNATNVGITYGSQLLPGSHNVAPVNGYNWQTSWLGDFYLPTNSPLIDNGSASANLLALYHFTTQTNQTKETNSIVDIGYHYVAIDPNTGQPYATFTNGVFDYISDSDGNGLLDSWEMQNFCHLGVDMNGDPDGDHLSNAQEYQYGTDPNNADTDGDGRTDWQEIFDNTQPLNAASKATWPVQADQPNAGFRPNNVNPNPDLFVWQANGTWYFGVTNGVEGQFYNVYAKLTSLSSPYWLWYGQVTPGAQYLLVDPNQSATFYNLSQTVGYDNNGIPDDWEIARFGHPGVDPTADPDLDGLSNQQEYLYGTNPQVSDGFGVWTMDTYLSIP